MSDQVICIKVPEKGWQNLTKDILNGPKLGEIFTVDRTYKAFNTTYLHFVNRFEKRCFLAEYFRPCKKTNIDNFKSILVNSKQPV
jgi:hypothetical protein